MIYTSQCREPQHHTCNNASPRIRKLPHTILPDTPNPHTTSTNRDDAESGLTNQVTGHGDYKLIKRSVFQEEASPLKILNMIFC